MADRMVCVGAEVVRVASSLAPTERAAEPLTAWLRAPAVADIRRLQRAIHMAADCDDPPETMIAMSPEYAASMMSPTTALLYTALFSVCRDMLRPFRASNPTWIRAPESYRHRLQPSTERIHAAFLSWLGFLCSRLTVEGKISAHCADIRTGTAQKALSATRELDACLASPPYATRIDYIKASLPELSVLGMGPAQVATLRRTSTGTPVVRGTRLGTCHPLLPAAADLIGKVSTHASHGSASYYAPWLENYLVDLDQTLAAIHSAVSDNGTIALVVQDSFYKAVRIDLQSLVTDSLQAQGRALIDRRDFMVTRSLASMNSRARLHLADRRNTESLLVFK